MNDIKPSVKNGFFSTTLGITLISIFVGILVGAIILVIAGYNPFEAYWVILKGIFSKPKYIGYSIIKSTPLIITGFSVAFAFKAGLFNIGAEGQYIVGALTAMLAGCFLDLPPIIHPIVCMALAIVAGAAWGGLSGFLKARFGIHEVISTIMLNWIALYLNNFITMMKGIKREHSEASIRILDTARIDLLGAWKVSDVGMAWRLENRFFHDLLKPDLNLGIFIAILLGFGMAFLLKRTTLGYELKAVGFNKDAAEYGGINVNRSFVTSMGIAGALAASAGAIQVLGVTRETVNLAAMEGFGFDGIAVALIGGNTSIGCFFSGLLFGSLKYGGAKIQSVLGAPKEIVNIVIGSIIFFVAMPKLIKVVTAFRKKRG